MKKFIYIGAFELPNKNAAAQRVVANAKIFRALGADVELIGVDKGGDIEDGISKIESELSHIQFKSISYPKSKKDWLYYLVGDKNIIEFLKTNHKDLDTVFLYNYPAIASLRIKLLLSCLGVRVICDITEWYSPEGEGFIFKLIKWFDTTFRIRFVASMGDDGVITTSQFMSDFYTKKGIRVLELPTLYDSVNLNRYKIKNKPKTPENKKKFIYFGSPFDVERAIKARSTIKERLDLLILAFNKLVKLYDFKFDIYGISKNEYLRVYPEHEDIIVSLKGSLFFYGKVEHKLLLLKIQEYDYTVFLRDLTLVNLAGFPSKMAESISLGVPVITNELPNLKKYSNCNGVFLCKKGTELEILESALNDKLECSGVDTSFFDYKNYLNKARLFLKL